MWELLANGLGLAGTGYSVLSGFSLDKKITAINSSLARLEQLHSQLNERLDSRTSLANITLPLITSFGGKVDPREQFRTAQLLAEYVQRRDAEIEARTSALFAEAIAEMRKVMESVRYSQSHGQLAPENLVRTLYQNPFEAGVVEYRDISNSGLYGLTEPYIVTPHLSPISWLDPRSGQQFLGKISTSDLARFGLKIKAPRYAHVLDGHIYSDRHGIYVPSWMI
jgi:hypothetical protein